MELKEKLKLRYEKEKDALEKKVCEKYPQVDPYYSEVILSAGHKTRVHTIDREIFAAKKFHLSPKW